MDRPRDQERGRCAPMDETGGSRSPRADGDLSVKEARGSFARARPEERAFDCNSVPHDAGIWRVSKALRERNRGFQAQALPTSATGTACEGVTAPNTKKGLAEVADVRRDIRVTLVACANVRNLAMYRLRHRFASWRYS